MRRVRWVLAAVTLGLVLVAVGQQDPSPGPLHPAHAREDRLAGAAGCVGCHGGPGVALADACGACHEIVLEEIAAGRGLHGALDEGRACGACHIEHRGGGHALVGEVAFGRAGVPDRLAYDHPHGTGEALVGRHLTLPCTKCHTHADVEVPAPGQARFHGLSRACTSCHDDVHRGALGRDCSGCHGQAQPFAASPGLDHGVFALTEGHAGRRCAACHPDAGPHAVAALRQSPVEARACVSCHASPHRAGDPQARVAFAAAARCADCHTTRSFAALPTAADHPRLADGIALRGMHAELACAKCHAAGTAGGARRDPEDCASCHRSPHRGGFVAATAGCAACHAADATTFRLPAAGLTEAAHDAAGFPLRAPHAGLRCAACHQRAEQLRIEAPPRRPEDCAACHVDPHAGQFAGAQHGSRCAACHAPERFAPSIFGPVAHAAAGFELTGAHAAVPCFACHEQDAGGVRRFRGAPRDCAACHEDVHRGAFDRRQREAPGCATCHDTTAFHREARPEFDHARWTGYALAGRHASLACSACHTRRAGPREGRPYAGLPTGCASCHRDPHAGQFRRSGRTDCSRCHTETAPFAKTTFDHRRDARFELDAVHAKLTCGACHRPIARAGGGAVVRYRPLGRRCGDCHIPVRGGGARR